MGRKRGAGEGSIAKRPNGTWYGRYTVHLPDGTTARRSVYGKTRREVAEKMAQVLTEIKHGTHVEPSKMTVSEYLTYWLNESVRPKIKPATYQSYEVQIRTHLIADLGQHKLQELTTAHVEGFRNAMLKTHSPRSVEYALVLLNAALELARKRGIVQRNVAELVDKPRVPVHDAPHLTIEQARTLLEALRGDRMEALYYLAVGTGLRRGELLGLHWCDVDLQRGEARINQSLLRLKGLGRTLQETKSHSGNRVAKLPQFVVKALLAHRDRQWLERERLGRKWQDDDLVFPSNVGTPLEPRRLNTHLDGVLKRASLPHMGLHGLRHSSATIMEAMGVSLSTVSKILGHSTLAVTSGYVHTYDESMTDAANRMDDLFGGA